jgi:N-formylglutamate amidohydrolase
MNDLLKATQRLGSAALVHAMVTWTLISAPAQTKAPTNFQPGKSYFGRNEYVEYLPGDVPVIISAPHGGRLRPDEIPDRTEGTLTFDTNTQELARAIAAEFLARTGHRPHIVLCRLHRRKVDCNRELKEAAAGNPHAEQAWREFQGYLETARKTVVARFGRGFYIDLHGHGHAEQQLELGYLHNAEQLSPSDADINNSDLWDKGGLHALKGRSKLSYAELLRGPQSFGAFLEAEGFPAAPSPRNPQPAVPFFSGGYNTVQHARDAAPICGLQIECNHKGVRDNEASMKKFSKALFNAVDRFLSTHLELKLPKKE